MYVNIEKIIDNTTGEKYKSLFLVLNLNKEMFPLEISIGDSIIKSFNERIGFDKILNEDEKESLQVLKQVFLDFLQVVMYMCCEKKDVVKLIKSCRKKLKNKSREKEITYSHVGFGIGKEILEQEHKTKSEYTIGQTFSDVSIRYKYEKENISETENKKESVPKAPHFRAAHWATYHVGKGREQTILKWINAVYVNGNKDYTDDMPVTLHDMR